MGKRELLLIVAFVIAGVVVYHATAPPADPEEQGFSFSKLVDHLRREIGGNRASTQQTTTATHAIDHAITEVRVTDHLVELQITGEPRKDVEATLLVHSSAYDEAEAKQTASETVLETDRAAASLILKVSYPKGGRQRAALHLKVPSHMRVRVESRPGKLSIDNVAGVEATNVGGTASIRNIAGKVNVTHRGGELTIADVDILHLIARSCDATVSGVRGEATITAEQGGELKATRIAGPVTLETRNAEVMFDTRETVHGPIAINAVNGEVGIVGLKTETRVEGRHAEIDVSVTDAAPIAIYSDGEDIQLTPPAGGFRLDAVVVDGRVLPEASVADLGLERSESEPNETRVSGAINGGGPTITIRATHGDFTLLPHTTAAADPALPASTRPPPPPPPPIPVEK